MDAMCLINGNHNCTLLEQVLWKELSPWRLDCCLREHEHCKVLIAITAGTVQALQCFNKTGIPTRNSQQQPSQGNPCSPLILQWQEPQHVPMFEPLIEPFTVCNRLSYKIIIHYLLLFHHKSIKGTYTTPMPFSWAANGVRIIQRDFPAPACAYSNKHSMEN